MRQPGFDIFCRVVDNYGDIGVCWRLAKQLAACPEAGPIRLWVDDLESFKRIASPVETHLRTQHYLGVELVHWAHPLPALEPHGVVIEAFACDVPPEFLARMADSLWINLEYLSAEDWIETCHGLPSMQPDGRRKFFFFPGFTAKSGGLLREPGLLERQADWLSEPANRWRLLQDLCLPQPLLQHLQHGWRQVLVFCYDNADLSALTQSLRHSGRPSVLLVPQGMAPAIRLLQTDTLKVYEFPFVDQDAFDRLLWSSDLNLVRGEDSLVRAIWAGRPFLWHIYQQDDDAHLVKLDAWLQRTAYPDLVKDAFSAWNRGGQRGTEDLLSEALAPHAWENWQQSALLHREQLAQQHHLLQRLLSFCAEKADNG